MRPAAVLLAAGGGSRFETGPDAAHKLLAPFRGRTASSGGPPATPVDAGFATTWVVTGAVDLDGELPDGVSARQSAAGAPGRPRRCGCAVPGGRAARLDAIVVGLGDQPLVGPDAWRAVADADGAIAVATYDGRRRNPVKLAAAVWDLLPHRGDEGARTLMRQRPDLVEEVPCQGDPVDIDTREDLQTWS